MIIAEVPDPFEDSKKPEPKTQTSGPKKDFDEDDIPF
jgi:hypothetical protein